MSREHQIEFRVRYYETDAQGVVHHANYLKYFEMGRVEQLLAAGLDYAQLEASGVVLVVAKASCRYLLPSRFGDTLQLLVRTERARGARIDHTYKVRRGDDLIAEGETTIACVDPSGRLQRLPDHLTLPE